MQDSKEQASCCRSVEVSRYQCVEIEHRRGKSLRMLKGTGELSICAEAKFRVDK